jgi:hypothetical protein
METIRARRSTHFLESAERGTNQDTRRIRASKGTHILESAEVGASQDTKTIRAREGHSLSGECTGEIGSEHGKEARDRQHSLSGNSKERELRHEKEASEEHSRTGERRGRGKSGHAKEAIE